MQRIIADLHVHSGYSRATSRAMNIETMALWAGKKGIHLLGTGDFTHPGHFDDIRRSLRPSGNGLYSHSSGGSVYFMLTAEVSSIYSQGGKVRKIHNLVFAPDMETAQKINKELGKRGNILSDGRPILGISARDLMQIVLDSSEDCLVVPAHVWTPWFSLFGSKSGFDSIQECFGEYSVYVYAVETGLSSDPQMNWRLSALDHVTLLSNSDAHSPAKLGREANVLSCEMDYHHIMDVIRKRDKKRFMYTIEFFPEEGKYHYDGHRACNVLFSPSETERLGGLCPVCNRPLTVGVLNRVHELADREPGYVPERAIPAKHLIPLQEIIAAVFGAGVNTVRVRREYERLLDLKTEFEILLDLPGDELYRIMDEKVAEGIMKVRRGDVAIHPGYDGIFGRIAIE
jgi:uncharacterized protein (TIGR00375 family)